MKLEIFQIDAFTNKIFGGNPACVVPLDHWLPDETLLNIARENAVAETAFFIRGDMNIQLRWFTPEIEMDLCGHATLATAHCLKTLLGHEGNEIIFETCSGELIVRKEWDFYTLDFPARISIESFLPSAIEQSLNIQPKQVLKSRDYILVYENEQQIRDIQIDRNFFDTINLDPGGVAITAPGDTCDFVSRYFTPQASILEDPVTGSAHCSLVPFWALKLGKNELHAFQISERVGELHTAHRGNRVFLRGQAKTYSVGQLWLE